MRICGTHPDLQNVLPTYLRQLESESIFILREALAQFENPVLLYSVGKDSSTLLHLAKKAFSPGKIPFPVMHVDTGYKFPEMYQFRDETAKRLGFELLIEGNTEAIAAKTNPYDIGTQACCGKLKTTALLDALKKHKVDAAIGGARREEERSRAKERIFSVRDKFGRWDPRVQRPELWNIYNGRLSEGQSMRVFPLSNWTEFDIWLYIYLEQIPVVPLYFAIEREVIVRDNYLIPFYPGVVRIPEGEKIERVICRFRSLGCIPCTGAVRSAAQTVGEIVEEMFHVKVSERSTRVIDHDTDGSMEIKKRDGYF
jgi:sulfate adenylyltransferase subunit 2